MACRRMLSDADYVNPIAVTGLCEDKQEVSNVISTFPYWKQTTIQDIVYIADTSPNIEEISSVNIVANISNIKVIKTPKTQEIKTNGEVILSSNLQGKMMTGRKIIIEGRLCQVIEYSTSDPYDNLRSMIVYNPFSSYIVVPEMVDINGEMIDALSVNFNVSACIEYLKAIVLDCRSILESTVILFYAVPNV